MADYFSEKTPDEQKFMKEEAFKTWRKRIPDEEWKSDMAAMFDDEWAQKISFNLQQEISKVSSKAKAEGFDGMVSPEKMFYEKSHFKSGNMMNLWGVCS